MDGGASTSTGPSKKCSCRDHGGCDRQTPPSIPKREKYSSCRRGDRFSEPSYSDTSSGNQRCPCGRTGLEQFSEETSIPDQQFKQSPYTSPSQAEASRAEFVVIAVDISSAMDYQHRPQSSRSSSRGHCMPPQRPSPVLVHLQSDRASTHQLQPLTPIVPEAPCGVYALPEKPPRKEPVTCVDDEEYFSLSSASSQEQVTVREIREITTCCIDSDYCAKTHTRNQAILNLLNEVVHLINDDKASSELCQTKIRNIGVYDHGRPEDGAFSSGFKITLTASHKETSQTCSRPCTEVSENLTMTDDPRFRVMSSDGGRCVSSAGAMQIENFNEENMADVTPVTIKQEPTDASAVINGPEILEEDTAIVIEPTSFEEPISVEEPASVGEQTSVGERTSVGEHTSGQEHVSVEGAPTIEDISTNKSELQTESEEGTAPSQSYDNGNRKTDDDPCPAECICNALCICPVHGPIKAAPLDGACVYPEELTDGGSPSCTEQRFEEGDEEGEEYAESEGRPKKSKSKRNGEVDHCDCCHCRAMRAHNNDCRTIATHEQAMRGGNECSEFKFFIDSIIMDLDAMENVRRAKKAQQNICPPPRPSICPRQSYPVTITEVTDLGTSSLYVKWCIHNCCGIAGYEIYVDNHLTNRYFHCNHTAAVVCDVDVTMVHKIVLLAQPKLDDSFADFCADLSNDDCKSLLQKSDIEKGDSKLCNPVQRSSVWIASIYMYDPMHKQEVAPIMRCSTRSGCL